MIFCLSFPDGENGKNFKKSIVKAKSGKLKIFQTH